MRTDIENRLKQYTTYEEKFNYLREFLQLLILKILDEEGYFRNLAFVGGTALRVLYDLNRFSEDLDFCLISKGNYAFSQLMQNLEKKLRLENFDVTVRYKDAKTVASGLIKFENLLYQLGLTAHRDKKLTIKFEVDQNTPAGYNTTLSVISNDFFIAINHFDLPSLLSGKLHALLYRKYTKGRDFYDYIWYVGKKITPNFVWLNNAISQTEHVAASVDADNIKSLLLEKFEKTNFNHVQKDIAPFLKNPKEIRYFNQPFFTQLVIGWQLQ